MELLIIPEKKVRIKAVLFDFDGTLSTLRHGWESIMEPLMLEMIAGSGEADEGLVSEVREYIDKSTGIQTIHQMQWLAEAVKKHGKNPGAPHDPWWYKGQYNKRLMEMVEVRKKQIVTGEVAAEQFVVKGSRNFLEALALNEVGIYAASGTDHPDVVEEAEILGFKDYFREIAGTPLGKEDSSKEVVLRRLIAENDLTGAEVAVIGDGRVEIRLGREVGALTLGVASDEEGHACVNSVKRARLIKAGAHAIVGDFEQLPQIMDWLGLSI